MDPNANAGGEPAAPVQAPAAEPAAPVTPPPAALDAPDAEQQEWDEATKDLFPGLKSGKKKEGDTDEPAKPGETTTKETTTTQTTIDPNETPEQKAERETKEAADAAALEEEDVEPDTTGRDNRLATREYQQQVDAVKSDIREKMFASVPTELKDADGDPIRGIEDVMKLINPRTIGSEEYPQGRAFTEEEAGMWLLSAQQQFNQTLAAVDKQIEAIAEVNLDLKDQADAIKFTYGELLKAMPELRDEVWADYEATLIKDPESGIILRAPISLQRFYERNLKPYADKAAELEANNTTNSTTVTDTTTVDPKVAQEEEKARKAKKRADRSDIYGGGNKEPEDPEDKEWSEAAEAVFGPRNNKK